MEAERLFETSVNIYPVTQCDIPEDWDLQQHRSENLKPHFMTSLLECKSVDSVMVKTAYVQTKGLAGAMMQCWCQVNERMASLLSRTGDLCRPTSQSMTERFLLTSK